MTREQELEQIVKDFIKATETAMMQEGIWFNKVYNDAKLALTIPVIIQALPKRLSNEAYKQAKYSRYEVFMEWWDKQV